MALILSLETTTKTCSVVLAENEQLLAISESHDNSYGHAEKLHVYVEEVLKIAGRDINELSAVAVAEGPGSYTGLRIGVSTAKGLCYALKIPLVAVDPLYAAAHHFLRHHIIGMNDFLIPMIDARRMEVFMAIYSSNGNLLQPMQAKIIDENFLSQFQQGILHFIGDGASKFSDLFLNNPRVQIHSILPTAEAMVKPAWEKFSNGDFADLAYFTPVYGKEFGDK